METKKKEIWYWKGFVHKGNGKLLTKFVRLSDDFKIIDTFMYLVKNKSKDSYILGGKYEILVIRDETGEAKQIQGRTYLKSGISENIINDWRIEHWAEEEEAQQFKDFEKAKKDSKLIENMKLKDLREFANKNYQNKRALKSYLDNLF